MTVLGMETLQNLGALQAPQEENEGKRDRLQELLKSVRQDKEVCLNECANDKAKGNFARSLPWEGCLLQEVAFLDQAGMEAEEELALLSQQGQTSVVSAQMGDAATPATMPPQVHVDRSVERPGEKDVSPAVETPTSQAVGHQRQCVTDSLHNENYTTGAGQLRAVLTDCRIPCSCLVLVLESHSAMRWTTPIRTAAPR